MEVSIKTGMRRMFLYQKFVELGFRKRFGETLAEAGLAIMNLVNGVDNGFGYLIFGDISHGSRLKCLLDMVSFVTH